MFLLVLKIKSIYHISVSKSSASIKNVTFVFKDNNNNPVDIISNIASLGGNFWIY